MDEFYIILTASTAMDIYHKSSNIFQMVDECSKEYAQGEDLNNISGLERVMGGGGGKNKNRDIKKIGKIKTLKTVDIENTRVYVKVLL